MPPTFISIYLFYWLDIDIPIQKTAHYSMTTRYTGGNRLLGTNKLEQKQRLLDQTAGYFT